MPRLNQNQRIKTLTMLARGDNVSNASRTFGCHRNNNSVAPVFPANNWVADRRRPGRPRVTNPRTDRFIMLTHLRRRFQTATSSARQYGISKQTVLRRPAIHSAKEALCGTSACSTSSGCPFAGCTMAFPLGATTVGSGSIL